MAVRGHDIEVFCSSPKRTISESVNGCLVHCVQCNDRAAFHKVILEIFEARQNAKAFDLVESPEYFADALAIKERFPKLPLVVKLHTPRFLIHELTYKHVSL